MGIEIASVVAFLAGALTLAFGVLSTVEVASVVGALVIGATLLGLVLRLR